MEFTILIYSLVFFLVIYSLKVIFTTVADNRKTEEYGVILKQRLIIEIEKQSNITQKIKLVDDLNQTLKLNVFKILKDILSFQNMVLKTTNLDS